jgi:uncharacterized membrane protein
MREQINRYSSRKFILAMMFGIASVIGMFLGTLDGGTFVAVATVVLGLYAGADVYQDIQHHKLDNQEKRDA